MSDRESLFAVARSGLRDPKGVHHSNCDSRLGKECDCYYRRSGPAHDAIDAIEAALTMMVESYELHDDWCGNLASAPGNSIHWQSINAARAALGVES